jgi:hypothetical protein
VATRYAVTKRIDAQPERIWTLLTDASGYAQWNPAIVSLDGAITLGGSIRLVSVVNPKRTFKLKVTHLEPPRLMIWADGMPLGLFKGVRTYTLTPQGTQTDFAMEEVFSGPLAPLITKAIPDLTDSFEQFAMGLKAAAELRPSGGRVE